jgi:hypothetical protein
MRITKDISTKLVAGTALAVGGQSIYTSGDRLSIRGGVKRWNRWKARFERDVLQSLFRECKRGFRVNLCNCRRIILHIATRLDRLTADGYRFTRDSDSQHIFSFTTTAKLRDRL